MNFQVGQKVVCVDIAKSRLAADCESSDYLNIGNVYTVCDCLFCRKCGCQSICVGFIDNETFDSICDCGCKEINQIKIWHYSRRFVPLEEYEASENMVEELLEPIKEKI